ncbi:GntR family transcriptional regulator [Nocardia sp. NPDC050630]|uniref:GntR family transcriptional regulator n=1 Tax=Nocardia sp. NPDC050630 TaxID=3364321 RepID=UPI00379D9916
MTKNNAVRSDAATSERVAAALRERIMQGELAPGIPLREVPLAAELDVSRNTLREALRLLEAEELVDLHRHRGAVVAILSAEDIRDIYRVRRVVELRAVDEIALTQPGAAQAMQDALAASEFALQAGAWRDVGTASLRFHQALVATLGSRRLDALFRTIVAQLRLAFAAAENEADLQRPWVARDREICELLIAGLRATAAAELRRYLDESERAMLELARLHPAPDLTESSTARRADTVLGGM